MATRLIWNQLKVEAKIEAALEVRLDVAAGKLRNHIQDTLRAKQVFPRSKPGEEPARETGALTRSIFWKKNGRLSRLIGTDLSYGLFLELGVGARTGFFAFWEEGRFIRTSSLGPIKPRPFLVPGLHNMGTVLGQIITAPILK